MKLARLQYGPSTVLAEVDGERATPLLMQTSDPWHDPLRAWLGGYRANNAHDILSLNHGRLLAPVCFPSKIIAVGLNYRDHADEQGVSLPDSPMLFTKAPSSIASPGDTIVVPQAVTQAVDYENELAVIIGTTARDVPATRALEHVFGYTICNDITARDLQKADGQFFRAKSFDTFCPLGPVIISADEIPDPQKLHMTTLVNGETVQMSSTAHMAHSVAEIIAHTSRVMTLHPGDVLITGTPAGVGHAADPPRYLQHGDTVECHIDQLGVLRNTVAFV